jgi:hypothetical protein
MESNGAYYEKTKLLQAAGNEQYDVFSRALETFVLSLGGLNLLHIRSLTPELNSSAQRCLTRFFTGDFAS